MCKTGNNNIVALKSIWLKTFVELVLLFFNLYMNNTSERILLDFNDGIPHFKATSIE